MGPRFNGVEDKPTGSAGTLGDAASMGPRFNGVEDQEKVADVSVRLKLQWGHALMAWKTQAGLGEVVKP